MNIDRNNWRQLNGKGGYLQPLVDQLYERIMSQGLKQLVNENTRMGWRTSSCLDLVFTSRPNKIKSCNSVSQGSSDHSLLVLIRDVKADMPKPTTRVGRAWGKLDTRRLKRDLNMQEIDKVLETEDVDEIAESKSLVCNQRQRIPGPDSL